MNVPASLFRRHLVKGLRVASPNAANAIVDSWRLDRLQNATVLEMYPGKGEITQALSKTKEENVSQIVAMGLPTKFGLFAPDDPRVHLFPHDPYHWDRWTLLRDSGLLSKMPIVPWAQEHKSMFMCGTFADNLQSEKFLVQLIHLLVSKVSIWSYGRFNFGCITSRKFFERLTADRGEKRHRTAVLASTLCDFEETWKAESMPKEKGPLISRLSSVTYKTDLSQDIACFLIKPKKVALVKNEDQFEALDFLTRHAFGHRGKPLRQTIGFIAPNAENLLQRLGKQGDTIGALKPADISIDQWLALVEVFLSWEFKPTTLSDNDPFAVEIDRE